MRQMVKQNSASSSIVFIGICFIVNSIFVLWAKLANRPFSDKIAGSETFSFQDTMAADQVADIYQGFLPMSIASVILAIAMIVSLLIAYNSFSIGRKLLSQRNLIVILIAATVPTLIALGLMVFSSDIHHYRLSELSITSIREVMGNPHAGRLIDALKYLSIFHNFGVCVSVATLILIEDYERETFESIRKRVILVRWVLFASAFVFAIAVVQLKLFFSFPSHVVFEESTQQHFRSMADASVICEGARYSCLLLILFLSAYFVLRTHVDNLIQRRSENDPDFDSDQALVDAGLELNFKSGMIPVVASLSPYLFGGAAEQFVGFLG